MTIGERILGLIKERGMTQKEFSVKTGIPQSTLSSWKSRNQVPGMDKIQLICDTLNVEPYYLLSGTECENKQTVDFIRINKADTEYELVMEYRKLDEGLQNRLMGYLYALNRDNIK